MKKTTSGFTIVELLIVIVVIAILAAISIVAYNGISARARDSQRSQDIASIVKALELYYIDNGQYPTSSGSTTINSSWSASRDDSWQNLASQLAPYMNPLPVDPTNSGSGLSSTARHGYAYFTNSATGPNYCGAGARQFYLLAYNFEVTDRKRETAGSCSSNELGGSYRSWHRAVK